MNIANSAVVSTATSNASTGNLGTTQGTAAVLVLKKALDVQTSNAIALLNALPQQPPLAAEGSLGRNLDTYA